MELRREAQPVRASILARPENAPEGERRGPARGPLPQHGVEHLEGLVGKPGEHVPGDEAGPRNGVPHRHFVEHPARGGQARALGVRVDEMVGEEEVMGEAPLDDIEVEALRGGVEAGAAATEEGVGVRVRLRQRARRLVGRRWEAVGEEVAEWNGRREAAKRRGARGRGRGGGGGRGAECEVR